MEVKLEGRDKLVKPLQPAKASCSMEVKLEGRDKLVKRECKLNCVKLQ